MAFKLTTQINVVVNKTQLNQAATDIRNKISGIKLKVNIEPTSGSLTGMRTAINTKLNEKVFKFNVEITKTSLIKVKSQINKVVSGAAVVIPVSINPKAVQQIKALNTAVKKTGTTAKVTGNLLEKLGKDAALAIRRFGAFTVATSFIIGFSVAVRQAVKDAIDFERQMIKVAQVTGKSIVQLQGLKNEITSLSIEFGVSSTALVDTARVLSQTGLSAKEVTVALRTLAKTELAPTFGDINKTVEASIAIMRQFEQGAGALESQLSAVNAVAGKFAVESNDIATAVRRTGGAFKAAGGNLNELIALFTSVRATTRESAESIATGFRTIFTRLQRTRTQDFLGKLGINLRDSEGQFIGPIRAIEKLSIALSGIQTTDPRFAQVLEELGGFRQISKAIPLIKQFATTQAALNVINREGATLDRDAALAQETLQVRIAQVRQEFSALIRTLTETETFKVLLDLTLRLASALIKVTDAIAPLVPLIAGLSIAKLATSVGPLAKGFLPAIKSGGSKNQGGLIPGRGPNVDSVAAVLTKGEFVLQRSAVDKIGIDNLQKLNTGRFNHGGFVGLVHGGDPHDTFNLDRGFGQRRVDRDRARIAAGAFGGQSQSFGPTFALASGGGNPPNGPRPPSGNPSGFVGPPRPPRNLAGPLGIAAVIGSLVNSLNELDDSASDSEKVFKGVSDGAVSVIGQLAALAFTLESVNLDKFASSINKISGGKLTGAGLKKGALIAGAIGVIGNEVGSRISQVGLDRIAATGQGSNLVQTGSVISGASTGAAIGVAFGPIGIAAGAAIGGLLGLAKATDKTTQAIEQFKIARFTESIGELTDIQKRFGVDSEQAQRQEKRIVRQTRDFGGQLGTQIDTPSFVGSIGDALKSIVGVDTDADVVIRRQEQAAQSFKDNSGSLLASFQNQLNRSSDPAATLKRLQGETGSSTEKAFLTILREQGFNSVQKFSEAALQGKDIFDALNRASKAVLQSFLNMQKLESNLLKASDAVSVFDAQIAAIKGETLVPDFSNLFAAARIGQLGSDAGRFRNVVSNVGAQTGRAGQRTAAIAQIQADTIAALPKLVERLATRSTQETLPLSDILKDELGKLVSGDKRLVNQQADRLIQAIAGNNSTVGSDVLGDLVQNPKKIGELFKVLQTVIPEFDKVAKVTAFLTKNQEGLIAISKEEIAARNQVIDIIGKGIGIRGQREDAISQARSIGTGGRLVPLGQRLDRSRNQLGNLLTGTGLGSNANIQQISALIQAQGSQAEATKRATKALKFLRDNTQDAANIQKDLNREQNKRKSRLAIAEIETFGSSADRRELEREREALKTVRRSGANNVSSQTRQRALSFINRLPTDEAARVKGRIIDRAGKGGPGITTPSAGEEKLIQGLDNAFQQRELANTALQQIVTNTAVAIGQVGQNRAGEVQRVLKRNSGGFVPGVGNSDSVNAKLTPGEFVIRKESAALLGSRFLSDLNQSSRKSTKSSGAGIRFQDGGLVTGLDGGNVNLDGVSNFNIAISNFVSGVNTLSRSLDSFPREITGNFRHSVEVIFNGAEIMTRLMPEMQDIALNAAKSELRKFVNNKLPDIGPID